MTRQNRQKAITRQHSDRNAGLNFRRLARLQKVGRSGRRPARSGRSQTFGTSAGDLQVQANGERCAAAAVENKRTFHRAEPFGGFEGSPPSRAIAPRASTSERTNPVDRPPPQEK